MRDEDSAVSKIAREQIVMHYQYLVEGLARKLKVSLPTFINDEDLISYGQIGLLRAMDRYNPEAGPFSRYASAVIYGAILDELRSLDWAPRGLRREQRFLESEQSEGATDLEAAMNLGWDLNKVSEVRSRVHKAEVSSFADVLDHGCGSQTDPSAMFSFQSICQDIVQWVDETFDSMAQYMIWLRYYYGMSVADISRHLKVSELTVRTTHGRFLQEVLPRVTEQVSS